MEIKNRRHGRNTSRTAEIVPCGPAKIISGRGLENGTVEFKNRETGDAVEIPVDEAIKVVATAVRAQPLVLLQSIATDVTSKAGESKSAFIQRVAQKARELRDDEVATLTTKWAPKIARAQLAVKKAEEKAVDDATEALAAVQAEAQTAIAEAQAAISSGAAQVTELTIAAKKTDVTVEALGLLWRA